MTTGQTRPKRANAKPGRNSLNTGDFDKLIEDQGVKVRITPIALCPNITDLESYNHVLPCPVCDNGIVDLDSMSQETWALITGIHKDLKFEAGIFDIKDAQITANSDVRLNYWHKVEVLDFTAPFNQLVKKSDVAYDRMRYTPVTATVNDFYAVGKDGTVYVYNVDFEVLDHGISWIGNAPNTGDIYSINYPMMPTYRVMEMLHANRFYYEDFKRAEKEPIQLPQNAHIRWDFLVKSEGYEKEAPTAPPTATPPPFKTGFDS